MLIAGAAPGNGVKADTELIGDVMRTFMELFDKATLTVEFPLILYTVDNMISFRSYYIPHVPSYIYHGQILWCVAIVIISIR